MRNLLVILCLLSMVAFTETFVINPHNGTTVDVSQRGRMLNVVCRFPAKRQFDPAINAKLNDQKSRRLFLDGLIRYFKAGSTGEMEVSGQHVLGVRKDGNFLVYEFAVPIAGCRVVSKGQSVKELPNNNQPQFQPSPGMPFMGVPLFQPVTSFPTGNPSLVPPPALFPPSDGARFDCEAFVRAAMEKMTNSVKKTMNGVKK